MRVFVCARMRVFVIYTQHAYMCASHTHTPGKEGQTCRSMRIAHHASDNGSTAHQGDSDGREHRASAYQKRRERPAEHIAQRMPLPLFVERLYSQQLAARVSAR